MKAAPVLLRADSAYYGHATVTAALRAAADVSITARQDPAVKRAIDTIPDDTWTKIRYTDAIYDPDTGTWTSDASIPISAATESLNAGIAASVALCGGRQSCAAGEQGLSRA